MGSIPGTLGHIKSTPGNVRCGGVLPYDLAAKAEQTILLFWGFTEPAGTNTWDEVGGRDGTIVGSPTLTDTALGGTISVVPGIGDGLIKTLASGDYVKMNAGATAILSAAANGAIEAWVRFATVPSGTVWIAGLSDGTNLYPAITLVSGVPKATAKLGATVSTATSSDGALVANRWYHLAARWKAGQVDIVVNGVSKGSATNGSNANAVAYSTPNLFVGGGVSGFTDASGYYSAVAAYSSYLSDTQVLAHYTQGTNTVSANARATQVYVEVLDATTNTPNTNARLTNLATEVLRDGSSRGGRISNLCIEVLRTSGVGLGVAASNSFQMAYSTAQQTWHFPTAATTITLSFGADELTTHLLEVSASHTVTFSDTAAQVRDLLANATSALGFADSGSEVDVNPETGLEVVNSFTLAGVADCIVIGDKPVDAASGLVLELHIAAGFNRVAAAAHTITFTAGCRTNLVVVAATSGLMLRDGSSCTIPRALLVSATDLIQINADIADTRINPIRVAATSIVTFSAVAIERPVVLWVVAAVSGLKLTARAAEPDFHHAWPVVGRSALALHGFAPQPSLAHTVTVSAASTLVFTPSGSEARTAGASAVTAFALASLADRSRALSVAALTTMAFGAGTQSNQFPAAAAAAGLIFTPTADAIVGTTEVVSSFLVLDRADATIQLPGGGGVPGGDANAGLRTVLADGSADAFPNSYAETPSGLLLIANGIDPMVRWDGLAASASAAGVAPPATAPALGGQDVGTITGIRYAHVRFIDRWGNPSDLGPISNGVNMGRDALIDAIATDPATGQITIRSDGHGLQAGEDVVIQGVEGLGVANGPHVVGVLDADHFYLGDCVATTNTYTRGGSWTWGIAQVVYQGVPAPADPRIARRQILRNLEGEAEVYYVDIDTTDLASTTFTSTRTDADLSAQEPVSLFGDDDLPLANRYGVPPAHKAVLASHLGRTFAASDRTYAAGCVLPRFGSATLRGVGTDWRANFAGRLVYVAGATQAYEIAAVDVAGQRLTLTIPYQDATQAFALYAIRSAPAERKLVYYSEAGLPEAWPTWNAFAVPEDSDDLTALVPLGPYLFLVERRHIYRYTFQDDPALAGNLFLSTGRGCINHRCWVRVEDKILMLDEVGIHSFDGDASTPISTPIQPVFQPDGVGDLKIDWSADPTLWHAAHDPVRDTVRWFVHVEGSAQIDHCLCYDYRRQRWWAEQYPTAITASTLGTVGHRRSVVGTAGRRVLVLGEGALDRVEASYRGPVTAADATSLTDSSAAFPDNLEGAPVAIVQGTGRGQQRMIASNTATGLEIVAPWDTTPDPTSVYQVGGIAWSWRSGWFEYERDESENPRDVSVVYQPLRQPASAEVRLFFDHADEPRNWARDYDADGVATREGAPYIDLDLTNRTSRAGYSIHRQSGHADPYAGGDLFVSVLLSGVQAGEPVRIFRVTINGANAPTEGQP